MKTITALGLAVADQIRAESSRRARESRACQYLIFVRNLTDRHIQVGFLISDPTVWKPSLESEGDCQGDFLPPSLPYTKASENLKKDEYKGSAEVSLKLKERDKIYADMSLYGCLINTRATDIESVDENYETISTFKNTKKPHLGSPSPLAEVRPPPPLPEKNTFTITATIESQANLSQLYASPRKVNFILDERRAYDEGGEEFEDICHPDDDPLNSIDNSGEEHQLIETHFV